MPPGLSFHPGLVFVELDLNQGSRTITGYFLDLWQRGRAADAS